MIRVSTPIDDLVWLYCPHCRSALVLHQPDEQCPDRMLGVCGVCRSWFILVLGPGRTEAVVALLPDEVYSRASLDCQLA